MAGSRSSCALRTVREMTDRSPIHTAVRAADVTRVKSFRSLLPGLLALLVIVSACGESETEFEGSLNALLRGNPSAGVMMNENLFAPPEEERSPIDDLVLCGDLTNLQAEDRTKPVGTVNLDSELLSVLSDYGTENRETFAGLWLDGDSSGGILLAFTDDVESHRANLMDRLGWDAWEAPFSIVEAVNSQTELDATARAVDRLGNTAVASTTVELKKNRVVLNLIDPTEAEMEELTASVDLYQVCGEVTAGPEIPEGPLEVLPQGGGGSLLSCDEVPFPASALDAPLPVTAVDHPAIQVLGDFIDGDPEWIVLDIGQDHALFAKYDGELRVSALATPAGDTWEIYAWTFGCDLKIGLPIGLGAVEIFVNPDAPTDPGDSSLDLVVSEVACAGGRSMGKRLLEPEVIETDDQVILAFATAQQNVEFLECPSNPITKVRVPLASPLAGRTVVDGTYLPPRPVGQPWFVD